MPSIGELLELRQIDLRGNPLTCLPAVIASLPKLEKLDLRWISAFELPDWLIDLEARGSWCIGSYVSYGILINNVNFFAG